MHTNIHERERERERERRDEGKRKERRGWKEQFKRLNAIKRVYRPYPTNDGKDYAVLVFMSRKYLNFQVL